MFVYGLLLLLLSFEVNCPDPPTTVGPVTTTAKPITTPAPVPSVPKYTLHNDSGICLMLQMNLRINIRYYDKQGEEQYKDFYLNKTDQQVTVNGMCTSTHQLIRLSWNTAADSGSTFSTDLDFTLGQNSDHFSLASIALNYTVSDRDFPGTNDTADYSVDHEVSKFTCPLGYYYRCLAEQTFELTESKPTLPKPKVLYEISSMKVEAFRNSNKDDFIGKERMCLADYVPNRVIPIVVGVILAVFILIAILAFIIGSRRRRVGYQTI